MAFLFCLCSCNWKWKWKIDDTQDDPEKIEIQRYDRLESRYLSTGDFAALQQMNTSYPMETRTLVEDVLQLGEINEPQINNKFLHFFQDSLLQNIISDAEAQYANMDDLNRDLSSAFAKLREHIPNLPIPTIYAQISSLDQSIIVGDKLIGISLDKYLGKDYPVYRRYYTSSQRETMERRYIVPDCIMFYLLSLYPLKNHDTRQQIERDIHIGKVMWVVNQVIPHPTFQSKYVDMVEQYMKKHKDLKTEDLLKGKHLPIQG